MRTHKFLVLVGDTEMFLDHARSSSNPEIKNVYYNEEPYMTVIECKREDFEDNQVIIKDDDGNDWYFYRDVDGTLFNVNQVMSKTYIINKFE